MIKQAIKNSLGSQNTLRVALFMKATQVATRRFFRGIFNERKSLPALPIRTFSLPNEHVFFGYYDVTHLDSDEKLLLAMAAPLINTTPTAENYLRLGYFDLQEKERNFHEFTSSNTWCWQQGCRLQWYPHKDNKTVIYNTMVDGEYGCVIQDINNLKIIKSFSKPIYSISSDGKWGLSLNFSRLQRLRPGYGYSRLRDTTENQNLPEHDGIWKINLETGEVNLLFSLKDVGMIDPCTAVNSMQHYFNHILFNPSGNRFTFYHILQTPDGKRFTRMFTSNLSGNDFRLLTNSGHVSHCCWTNDKQILAYSTADGIEGYHLYDDTTEISSAISPLPITEDGHPSYSPDKTYIVTDTYPDKYGEQHLLLYDCVQGNVSKVLEEYSSVKFHSETRCDLHPRISPTSKYICIDCVKKGKRVIKVINVSSFF